MKRILITGAKSFVGRNYIRLSEHKEIDEISLFDIKPEDINFKSYDVVIHLVAIVHQSTKIDESDYFKINKDLCISVATQAKKAGVSHFIFFSTIKVYGKYNPGSGPWNENSECYPEDAYGKSKYEAESDLKKMADTNFVISIVRTPLVYGKGVKANMQSILKLVDSFPVLPFKNVENKRSFTSVENLSAFIDQIILKRISGVFIVMDEKPLSTTELVKLFSKFLGKKIILFKMPEIMVKAGINLLPKIFDRLFGSFELDNSTTLKMLDFKPPFSSEYCIEKMVESYMYQKKQDR